MKRLSILFFTVLILSGCGKAQSAMERSLSLRSDLLKAQGCSFTARITADYGDELHTFTMESEGDALGNLSFRVSEPESISGITGTLSQEGGALTFDDTALAFPFLADGQLSPVSAPWVFLKTLRSGCITSAGFEDGLLRLTVDDSYDADALTLDIWLDEKDCPVEARILYRGRQILSLEIRNFTIV